MEGALLYNLNVQTIVQYELDDEREALRMNGRETLAAARRSKAELDALLERKGWCQKLERCHSGGESRALEDLRKDLDRRIDTAAQRALEAQGHIDVLPDRAQREVLSYRYLNGWEWKDIARRMNYSVDWVKHIHARAMREMGD